MEDAPAILTPLLNAAIVAMNASVTLESTDPNHMFETLHQRVNTLTSLDFTHVVWANCDNESKADDSTNMDTTSKPGHDGADLDTGLTPMYICDRTGANAPTY
jgi:hypothetical protein